MTTTVRTPRHVEQDLASKPTDKTPYELACESGFIGSLSTNENIAGRAKIRAKEAITGKHSNKKI
ncbi:hypothetical protein [Quatrionicoccus australiensis]|uniref:hypothetical protein n=1 Tax=Quatrionicoccus australiensis TaxID=138118 RepID=UPI001CF91A3D|nr:hypothetical protein [Quatrionicoccus australiensis]UCV16529.1 hypothetical protein KI612_07470 [Quatrionicoccus australiensis]